jgi:tetratricopeptide (TPR) repeat protein
MGKHLKNHSLRLKIIPIMFLSIFLLCTSAYSEEDLSESLNKQVVTFYQQGRYSEATEIAQEVLQLREKALGPDHPDVAISLNNLAAIYEAQGKYAEAEPLYKRSLEIRKKALGPDHPYVATSLNNLAELYRVQGKYAVAEHLYKRSLEIWEKALGPDHPYVATSLNNLVLLYEAQGNYAEAEPFYMRLLEIGVDFKEAQFVRPIDVDYTYRGISHLKKEQIDDAISDFDKAIELNAGFAAAYVYRGIAHYKQGQFDQAISDYDKAIEINPEYAEVYYNRGDAFGKQGQFDQAISDYNKAIEINPEHAEAYLGRGLAYDEKRRYNQAIADFNKAIELNPEDTVAKKSRDHTIRILSQKLSIENIPTYDSDAQEWLLEEIIVIGDRSLLSLKREIYKAEDLKFDLFNALNSTDEFDITCKYGVSTGSRIKRRVCDVGYMKKARAEDARQFLYMGIRPRTDYELARQFADKTEALNKEMVELGVKHPSLAKAMINEYVLKQCYIVERRERFKDSILIGHPEPEEYFGDELKFLEFAYIAHNDGMLEEEIWTYWDTRFRSVIHQEPYRSIWLSSNSETYADEFIAYVNTIISGE